MGAPLETLVSLSADGGQWRSEKRVQEAVGDRGRVENEMIASCPERGHGLVRGSYGRTHAVADTAIGMVRQRTGLACVGLIGHALCLLVLVLVVTDVGARRNLLMRADARRRRPGPLERQQHHQEDKQQATHDGAQSSKARDGGQSCGGLMRFGLVHGKSGRAQAIAGSAVD